MSKHGKGAVLIRIIKTGKEERARSYGNGWILANGDLIHRTAAVFIKVLEES